MVAAGLITLSTLKPLLTQASPACRADVIYALHFFWTQVAASPLMDDDFFLPTLFAMVAEGQPVVAPVCCLLCDFACEPTLRMREQFLSSNVIRCMIERVDFSTSEPDSDEQNINSNVLRTLKCTLTLRIRSPLRICFVLFCCQRWCSSQRPFTAASQ